MTTRATPFALLHLDSTAVEYSISPPQPFGLLFERRGVAVVLMAAFTSGAVTPDAPGIVAVEGARNI